MRKQLRFITKMFQASYTENPLKKKKSIRGCYQVNLEGIKSTYFYKTIHLTTLYNVLAHYQNAKVKWIVFKNHIT